VDRRIFLATVAAGILAAAGAVTLGDEVGRGALSARATPAPPPVRPTHTEVPRAVPADPAAAQDLPPYFLPPNLTKHPVPTGTITGLPGQGNSLALTVDDGVDTDVVRLYTEFAEKSGLRFTFFPNGSRPSWTDNAAILKPLVQSGQIQLGNHTWSHPDLTKLSDGGIVTELQRNEDFIQATYGVSAKPYFRPPYGFHDARVDSVARSIGYSVPVLWYGSLSDSGLITDDQLKAFATQWILPQHIVIGHANFLPVTECFDFLADLIRSRGLQPVTLNDYFG
jgi:peptidoglycan/xylan/chitin deacetylase (PgdA/CDA1 family)